MIVLERFAYAPLATLGYLYLPGRSIVTIEQPWNDNLIGHSCIPEGQYDLEPDETGKHRWFRIPDEQVEPRSGIELHPANRASELRGCIAPGMFIAADRWAVERSEEACRLIRSLLPEGDRLWITNIIEARADYGR